MPALSVSEVVSGFGAGCCVVLVWDAGWVDRNQFLKNFELLKKNKLNNSYFIWQLVNLEAWNKLN